MKDQLGLKGAPCQCNASTVMLWLNGKCMREAGPGLPGGWGTPAPQSGGDEPAAPETRGRLAGRAARPGSRQM
jgi:hypothetical protein